MKIPYFDIHIVKGRNVVTEAQLERGKRENGVRNDQLKEYERKNNLRNKMMEKLLDKIEHLKGLLRGK